MRTLITALAASLALAAPAAAKEALWSRVGNWEIRGDTKTGVCHAKVGFTTGHIMMIFFAPDETVSLSVIGVPADNGRVYEVAVMADDGNFGSFDGVGVGGGAILFTGLNKSAVRSLARAKNIAIQGIGSFSLNGSKKAMAEAWNCMETLNSF